MWWVLAISVSLLGYTYAGYPVLIWLLAKVRSRPVQKGAYAGGVSVLIAAHNEADALPRKLEQLVELARGEPIREIWLGLDGCTDGTGDRVWELLDKVHALPPKRRPRSSLVHILEFESQRGKAAVLNDLMAKASQPIWVMMDARQRVEPGAIRRLLENFADSQVGVVSGALVFESADGGVQKGAESYWGYEKFLRQCESRFWAVPGATGALYAIRRELCRPIPENTLVDDVLIPMRAILGGFRCIFEPSARVFDLPSARFDQEGTRKRRTLAGIWQLGSIEPQILSFFGNPIWFQWISHKFLRLWTPLLILTVLVSTGLLEGWHSGAGQVLLGGMAVGIGISGLAYAGGKRVRSRWLGLLGAFFGVNLALVQAAWDAWRGRYSSRWK